MLEDRNISGLIDVIARASDPRYDPTCKAAALALGKLGEAAIGPILHVVKQRRLYTENERGLLSSLSHITEIQAVEPLAGILEQKKHGEEYAAHALGEIGGAGAAVQSLPEDDVMGFFGDGASLPMAMTKASYCPAFFFWPALTSLMFFDRVPPAT